MPSKRKRPALTPEGREGQLIALAENLAEQKLLDGTASSQLITTVLKRGSSKERLEIEKLKKETELLKAKTESLQSIKRVEELMNNALSAMRSYSGRNEIDEY